MSVLVSLFMGMVLLFRLKNMERSQFFRRVLNYNFSKTFSRINFTTSNRALFSSMD